MKRLLTLVAFFATLQASAQQVNPVPDYVFRNQMSVGRGTVTDTAAYFSIGPRYGATKGFMPPIVGDTATFSSGKRNGLLIFSVQKNKFLYWDSVRVQWSDMAGSSGSYITGSGITGYLPQFSASTTLDTSALFTLGNRLGIGTTSFAYNSTNTANMELNGTAGGILGFKRNDSARGYLWHTGDNMELANTIAGSISFNTNSATRGSISSAGVWRLHNLAGTGDRVVQASSNGTLSATTSVTGLVDTLTLSTRAWRQKAVDSLQANINAKGNGTVTSVATGFGLSGGTITTTGTLLVDTLNISTRAWRQKGLDSLAALEVSGSGTTNYVPKFTAGSTIGNSQIFDNGTNVGVGTASPTTLLTLSKTGAGTIGPNLRIHNTSARQIGNTSRISFAPNADYTGTTTAAFIDVIDTDGIPANPTAMVFGVGIGGAPTERLRITAGGDVGIGTTSPAVKLDVSQASTGSVVRFQGDASLLRYLEFKSVDVGAFTGAGWDRNVNSASGFHSWSTVGVERLRITSGGDVGIGTSSPTGTANRFVNIYGAASNELHLTNATTGTTSTDGFTILQSGNDIYQYNYEAGFLEFGTSNASRLRIFANGRVGINTTTDAGYQLDVNGTLRSVNGANFATTSGNVGVGTASPAVKLDVNASGGDIAAFRRTDAGSALVQYTNANTTDDIIHRFRLNSGAGNFFDLRYYGTSNYFGVDYGGTTRLAVTNGGNVGIGTTSPGEKLSVSGSSDVKAEIATTSSGANANAAFRLKSATEGTYLFQTGNAVSGGLRIYDEVGGATRLLINSAGELLINTTTDAGDYKLQVVGNARIGTGKLDISSNTTFGIGVARSGTSEVAGQIYNSNGILYTGVESSAGGQIFSGSSAYAGVIGTGAAYPLQFAVNNATRATINTNGELLINTTTDNGDFKLQVNGNALISGSIKTANGGSSTAVPWHLGSVVATNVQLDTANYVEVEINGVYYRLAIVTPL